MQQPSQQKWENKSKILNKNIIFLHSGLWNRVSVCVEDWTGPGDLAYDAWKQEKLMRAYDARKKLEMTGAMVLSSAETETDTVT